MLRTIKKFLVMIGGTIAGLALALALSLTALVIVIIQLAFRI